MASAADLRTISETPRASNPTPERTAAFFKYCNEVSASLRTTPRIKKALGLVGVSEDEVDDIVAAAFLLWKERQTGQLHPWRCRDAQQTRTSRRRTVYSVSACVQDGMRRRGREKIRLSARTKCDHCDGESNAQGPARDTTQVEEQSTWCWGQWYRRRRRRRRRRHENDDGVHDTAQDRPAPEIHRGILGKEGVKIMTLELGYVTAEDNQPSFELLCQKVKAFPLINWPNELVSSTSPATATKPLSMNRAPLTPPSWSGDDARLLQLSSLCAPMTTMDSRQQRLQINSALNQERHY